MILWPSNIQMTTASTLNALDGAYTSNAAILPVAPGVAGYKAMMNGPADLLIDVSGYFVPVV